MDILALEPSLVSWTLLTVVALSAAVIGKVGLGMLRAYYILRVRAGLPVVLWFPKFWRMDGSRQTGSSLSRVLKRMERLRGPHGMYGTVFGSQAVLHVADPEAAALVLSQHTKRPGYDHFGGFFGRGVFTADGEEWRKKRVSVAHALFRGSSNPAPPRGGLGVAAAGGGGSAEGGGGKALAVLANEEADSLLREVQALRDEKGGGEGEVEVEIVRLLQRHTLNLIHRFLCGGEDVCASPERKRLLPRYLDAVTDMRMVILARSRSVWMFAWGWVYRAFSSFHAREARNMVPIREFAELVLDTAVRGGESPPAAAQNGTNDSSSASRDTAGVGGGSSSTHEDSDDHRIASDGVRGTRGRGRLEGKPQEKEARDEDEEEGVVVGEEADCPPQLAKSVEGSGREERREDTGDTGGNRRGSDQDSAGRSDSSGNEGPKTALSNMAARESHRAYPGSMVDETITLLFAGQDTSAATLSWTMHLLSLPENRPYLLQVRKEVLAAVDPSGQVDCSSSSSGSSSSSSGSSSSSSKTQRRKRSPHMPMVDACIRESQRLYPVAPFVVRRLSSDLRLKDGTLLPAGALACVWIYGLHRHPALWESPDAFLPERWLGGAAARQPAGAFMPYASGPRGCVGRPFAGVALRIMLARLCLALDFSPAEASDPDTPTAAAASHHTVAGRNANSAAADEPTLQTGGSKAGAIFGSEESAAPPLTRKLDHHTGQNREQEREELAESNGVYEGRDVLTDGKHDLGASGKKVAGAGGARGGSKDMQAGFTVLPGGGVHLRIRKWED